MTPDDRRRFPAVPVTLRDGRTAVIRPLLSADGEAMVEFYAAVPSQDFRFYCPHPLDRAHALANAARADSPLELVQVLDLGDGRIGGYAWCRWNDPQAPQSVFGLCVRPECQNAGAGRALMGRVLEIARVLGPPRIALTVQKANPRAVALYRSMGFCVVREQVRPAGFQPGLPEDPEYAMERPARTAET